MALAHNLSPINIVMYQIRKIIIEASFLKTLQRPENPQLNNEFIKCFHKNFPRNFLSLSSWKRKQTSYLSKAGFFSESASWKLNNNKYSLNNKIFRFGIQDWWNYLINSLHISVCSWFYKKSLEHSYNDSIEISIYHKRKFCMELQ